MFTRRAITAGIALSPLLPKLLFADEDMGTLDQLIYPEIDAIDAPQVFGYDTPTQKQKDAVKDIINATPKGPTPLAIAQSFVDRFYTSDPKVISQWPVPDAWNPLVVEFFSATTLKANSDMVAWCAAFANWCLKRAGHQYSNSAASQSFLDKNTFKQTDNPSIGDLAVFTCFDKKTDKSVGLGHVAFVKEKPKNNFVILLGGNQSADGHSSIISARSFSTKPRDVRRRIGNQYVLVEMRLNAYINVV